MLVDKETLPILLSVAEGTSVKYIIVDGTLNSAELTSAKEKGIQLEEFKNVESLGAANPVEAVVPGKYSGCYLSSTRENVASDNTFDMQHRKISVTFTLPRHRARSGNIFQWPFLLRSS